MFECLKNLHLTNFDLNNWVSVLCHYAAAHPEYRDITKWSGRSLAEIEYKDVGGQFTDYLIRNRYLPETIWKRERPYYYYEVKTTKSTDRQEPFHMSCAQYKHVDTQTLAQAILTEPVQLQKMKFEEGKASPMIYVVARLYSLGKGTTTGFDLYVDPETKRK